MYPNTSYSTVMPSTYREQNKPRREKVFSYVPYQREVTEYVTKEIVELVPVQKTVTDYYAV
jgi:hypothetical protein